MNKNNSIDYISIKEASIKWDMDVSKIGKLIRSNRIFGVTKIGCHWLIPANVDKPIDNRTKLSKEIKSENIKYFRYPSYIYQELNTICPPLDNEEKLLKLSVEEFLACNFQKANSILSNQIEKIKNRYNRIYALYIGCMIDIVLGNRSIFLNRFDKLNKEFKNDFPYKKEMSYLLYEINAILGHNKYFIDGVNIDSTYDYHNSFLPHLVELSAVALYYKKNKTISEINSCEISSKMLEESKYPFDMQSIYVYLGSSYAMLGKSVNAIYYYKKALNIAYKYNSFYGVLDEYYYMKKLFEPALKDFPLAFKNKINELSIDVHKRTTDFVKSLYNYSIYSLFPQKDYILIFYAVYGYTNKEIASLLNLSEISVSKRYSELYDIANIKGKKELVNLFNSSVNTSFINK